MKRRVPVLLAIIIGLLVLVEAVLGYLYITNQVSYEKSDDKATAQRSTVVPELKTETVVDGLSYPWDIGILPDGTLIYTERGGTISAFKAGAKVKLSTVANVFASGEGGLLGLAIDPEFSENHYIYACYDTPQDIRLSRWKVNDDVSALSDQTEIITGMPVNTTTFPGRHSGCRPRFGSDGYLWIGTGDVAVSSHPQDPKSLGGKILRVDHNGQPAPGNLSGPFDPRIYSYGHRNVQGLAFTGRTSGVIGYNTEHGPDKDDEVNLLKTGNFGWGPTPPYDERVSMTDKARFPDAIESVWSAGTPPVAPSGATILSGSKWQAYEDALAVVMLRGRQLRLFFFEDDGSKLKDQKILFENELGRLRTAVMGLNQELYISTDNGPGEDKIIKISP